MSRGFDRQLTVFSPQGRLYQIGALRCDVCCAAVRGLLILPRARAAHAVRGGEGRLARNERPLTVPPPLSAPSCVAAEYAFKAVLSSGLTSVAARGDRTVCMVTQKKVPDKLIDPTSMTNMHKITPKIGVCVTGQPADAVRQVERMRAEAAQFMYDNGYAIPVHHLAKRMADVNQVFSQRAGTRTMAVISIICGIDEERGAQLFKVDPAGQVWGFHACAAGVKQMAAQNHFEKVYKDSPTLDRAATVQAALLTLQTVLQVDLRADDVEVSIVHEDELFRNLDEAEIEAHLQALADRD